MSRGGEKAVFELRYLGETIGWATVTREGCVLEPANLELDGPIVHRLRGIVEWLVQDAAFAA